MNDKTNEEKLRILQERLASIQQKKGIHQEEKIQQNKPVAPVFKEELVNHPNIDPIAKTPRQPKNNSSLFKYFILFFVIFLVGYGGFYAYNSSYFNSFFTSINPIETEEKIDYYKSSFDGNFIIILNTFDKKELANAESQNLTETGYNCDVFQLSGEANSEKEIFQTYIQGKNIGVGFETKEEAIHYLNSTELISEGNIFKLQ